MLAAACRTPQPRLETVQRSQPLLGTFVTITVHGADRAGLHRAVNEAFEEFRKVDALLSIHRNDSELALLNARAGQGPVAVSAELAETLRQALQMSELTGGAFDVTIGPIAQLWGFIWKEHRLPSSDELARVLPLAGHRKIRLTEDRRAELPPGMQLDFGGMGKGLAVDRAIAALERHGVGSAMVKAGGDLRVLGLPPGKDGWEVQIEDPAKQGRRASFKIKHGALSTSGNYENFFEVEGRRYSHIIDPRNGMPVEGIASCTVLAPTCAESDVLGTAFFVMGPEQVSASFNHAYAVRFVLTDGKVVETSRFGSEFGFRR